MDYEPEHIRDVWADDVEAEIIGGGDVVRLTFFTIRGDYREIVARIVRAANSVKRQGAFRMALESAENRLDAGLH